MIGFLKPNKMELLLKDCLYYKLYYCSVCRHLVRNNFRAYAFLNSFEGTLLAMLYNEMVVRDVEAFKDRCSGVPIAKVASLRPENEAVELGAFISLLAFRIKFQDNLDDETGWWITLYNRFLLNHLNRNFTRKQNVYGKFNIDLQRVRSGQKELAGLEKDGRGVDVYLDCWSELFSYIMTQAFAGKIEDNRLHALKTLFTGLGKIINLMDAMSDIHDDHKSGKFNLLSSNEPSPPVADDAWLKKTYDTYFQRIMGERELLLSTLPRLQLQDSFPIVHNILTHCLDKEMKIVFELMVLKKQNTQKTLFNCKEF